MNIAYHVKYGRDLFPNKPALIFESQLFTYGELDELSNCVANSLSGLGVTRGDRVALSLPNIPAFVFTYLAIQKLGAVAVSMNPMLKAEEAAFILNDSGAVAMVTTAALRDQLLTHVCTSLRHVCLAEGEAEEAMALPALMDGASSQASIVDMAPTAPSTILYTSGTTGFPKGATLSHGNVISNVRACVSTFGMQSEDRVLLCLPAFHCFGQNAALNSSFEAHATLILHRQFDVEQVRRSIKEHGVTMFFGVPPVFRRLLHHATPEELHSVCRYISAASNLPVEIARQWYETYGVAINEGYGLTETSLACFNHVCQDKLGSVGVPLEGIEMQIVDTAGREVAVGELGEVVIRGPNVMSGYWQRPAETAEVIRDGWFYTGDIGRQDDESHFYIVDRSKDMINVGGLKVYPSEVENRLYQHPAIVEAAVYGVPEALLGEQVRASIVLKSGQTVTAEELIAFCRQRLADFKVPQVVEMVETLPKSRTGKILKRVLREAFQADAAERGTKPNKSLCRDTLLAATPEERQQMVAFHVVESVARVLGVTPSELPEPGAHMPLITLGLDSMRAMELGHRFERDLDVSVPVVDILGASGIAHLTTLVLDHLTSPQDVEPTLSQGDTMASSIELRAGVSPEKAEEMLALLDQLSDADVDHLLQTLSSEEKEAQ
jgi:long-chain acyl-CoA synthetase